MKNGKAASIQNQKSLVTSVWFAVCMLFLRMTLTAGHDLYNVTNEKRRFRSAEREDEPDIDDNAIGFVQWYEILDRKKLAVDRIDEALGCV